MPMHRLFSSALPPLVLGLAFLLPFVLFPGVGKAQEEAPRSLGPFSLTERNGQTITQEHFRGKVWIASFLFTRCRQGCPQVADSLAQLQEALGERGVLLVSFTVDPRHDGIEELQGYANQYGAHPEHWLFLTGEEEEIRRLHDRCFGSPSRSAAENVGKTLVPQDHSTKLVLIDGEGNIQGYYDGLCPAGWPEEEFQKNLRRLERDAIDLVHTQRWYLPSDFPRFNASLNALCVCLLITGFLAIRQRFSKIHITCMLGALAVSALFLVSYLYYHLVIRGGQPTRFRDQAPSAPEVVHTLYYVILLTHTVLAMLVAPLAVVTAYLGLRGRLGGHMRLARWTLPLWLYVSITGVVVYWMLYRLYTTP
jgi:uncharacterized membrane protein YozB (DUF420 family)/cytochrome oxidase Cu insertion factor (SCO1/SenC/PrrC family)